MISEIIHITLYSTIHYETMITYQSFWLTENWFDSSEGFVILAEKCLCHKEEYKNFAAQFKE